MYIYIYTNIFLSFVNRIVGQTTNMLVKKWAFDGSHRLDLLGSDLPTPGSEADGSCRGIASFVCGDDRVFISMFVLKFLYVIMTMSTMTLMIHYVFSCLIESHSISF